jgi:predicted DNA-binding transcriptional regulator AlpA
MQLPENIGLLRLVEAEEVARMVAVSPGGLKRHANGAKPLSCLKGFPPPARAGRGQRVFWLLADVVRWLQQQSTYPTQHDNVLPMPRRGRPRKGVGA